MFGRGNSSNGKVCQFFLEGRCRFGDNCKNEHPRNQNTSPNRFAPLQDNSNNAGGRGRSGALGGGNTYRSGQSNQQLPFHLNYEAIKADLTPSDQGGERPSWPLSSYGPGRDAPRQLLEGAIEQSFEEVRLQYYGARASGNEQGYLQTEKTASDQASQQAQNILNALDGAVKYVIDGEHEHPNRLDQVVTSSGPWIRSGGASSQANRATPFGGASSANGSTFGQPSSFGTARATPFGQPSSMGQGSAFGQPSTMGGGSAFGQPSSLTQKPAFGQPSSAGGNGSAFGQPSSLGGGGGGSAFGQPSSLGGQQSAVGRASTPSFGQPAFGQPSKSAFGAPSQPTSGFGQASALGTGQSPFGQPSQPKASPFAAPTGHSSTFAQANAATSTQQGSSFGQPSAVGGGQQQPSPFGQPSAFGQQPQQPQSSTPFGQASSNAAPSTFGATNGGHVASNSPIATKPATSSAFGQPSQSGSTTFGQPPQAQATPFGQASQQNDMIGNGQANGVATTNGDAEGPTVAYTGEIGAILKDAYEYVRQTGLFRDGVMPETPPKREWIVPVS